MADKKADENAAAVAAALTAPAPAPARDERAGAGPVRERRSKHRVADDQGSGQGALTALSKLRMLERARASVAPRRDREGRD